MTPQRHKELFEMVSGLSKKGISRFAIGDHVTVGDIIELLAATADKYAQRCGTCKHYEIGNPRSICWAPVPFWVRGERVIEGKDGAYCETWAPKEDKL